MLALRVRSSYDIRSRLVRGYLELLSELEPTCSEICQYVRDAEAASPGRRRSSLAPAAIPGAEWS